LTDHSPNHEPFIDALLTLPDQGANGKIAICTNSTAAGQVFNEIGELNREQVPVLGTMIVNRDGAERMIVNSLVDPTVRAIVLSSEETHTFAPSSNLLSVLMNGLDDTNGRNQIVGGVAASAQYPNLNQGLIDRFRDQIVVLPLYTSKLKSQSQLVEAYLETVGPQLPVRALELLHDQNGRSKIYYSALNDLLAEMGAADAAA